MADHPQYFCEFATIHSDWPWMRQTQDGQGGMGCVQFSLAPQSAAPSTPQAESWLVVFDEAPAGFGTTTPRERRILFVTEPPEIKKYPRSYLAQFGMVVSPYDFRSVERRSMVIGNPCLNWHFGVSHASGKYVSTFGCLDELRHMPMPQKTGLISVVCSNKTATEAQGAVLSWSGCSRSSWVMCPRGRWIPPMSLPLPYACLLPRQSIAVSSQRLHGQNLFGVLAGPMWPPYTKGPQSKCLSKKP